MELVDINGYLQIYVLMDTNFFRYKEKRFKKHRFDADIMHLPRFDTDKLVIFNIQSFRRYIILKRNYVHHFLSNKNYK